MARIREPYEAREDMLLRGSRLRAIRNRLEPGNRVMIYPFREDGTVEGGDVDIRRAEPFVIRDGSREWFEYRFETGGGAVTKIHMSQIIAGVTEQQMRHFTPQEYFDLRRNMIRLREERRGYERIVGQRDDDPSQYLIARDVRFTPVDEYGQPMMIRHSRQIDRREIEGQFIAEDRMIRNETQQRRNEIRVQINEEHQARLRRLLNGPNGPGPFEMAGRDDGVRSPGDVQRAPEDLRIVEHGPDKGTTERWVHGRIEEFTVDGVYYRRGQGGPSHVQALFMLKNDAMDVDENGDPRFIYDSSGYVNSSAVRWDAPFIYECLGQTMVKGFSELEYDELMNDKELTAYLGEPDQCEEG